MVPLQDTGTTSSPLHDGLCRVAGLGDAGVHEGGDGEVDVAESQRLDLDRVHHLVLRRQAGRPLVPCSERGILHHLVLGALLKDHSYLHEETEGVSKVI